MRMVDGGMCTLRGAWAWLGLVLLLQSTLDTTLLQVSLHCIISSTGFLVNRH